MLTLVLLLMAPLTSDSAGIVGPSEGPSRRSSGTCAVVVRSPVDATPRPAREDGGGPALDRRSGQETRSRPVRGAPLFSAARTVDLPLRVLVGPSAAPAERLELRLYTPKGHLYQTLRATPPPDTDAGSQTRAHWTAVLPVAGTAIVNHSLYGRWRVEPHLDGNPRPCGPAQLFSIEP